MPVYRALYKGTKNVAPKSINNLTQSARINHLDLRYDEGVSTITFYADVSSSSKPSSYSCIVSFKGVKRTDGLTEEEIIKGFQPKPSLSKHEILVRCSCPNYRFRFDKANRTAGAGTGARFPNYHRKTDRAPNNPYNLPGMCSHLIEFIDYLQKQGFIH